MVMTQQQVSQARHSIALTANRRAVAEARTAIARPRGIIARLAALLRG